MLKKMRRRVILAAMLAFLAVILMLVFVLVALLSGKAIRPIANNIRQQKQFITDQSRRKKEPRPDRNLQHLLI